MGVRPIAALVAIIVAAVAVLILVLPMQGERGVELRPSIVPSSPAFANGSWIPADYTCDGADTSPPLEWSQVPEDSAALAVTMIDIDAPGGHFVHWVLYNVPPNATSLPPGVPRKPRTELGLQALNDFGFPGYGGPCPPPGKPHRYVITVYALASPIDLPGGGDPRMVIRAIEERAIAYGRLVGLYGRR